MTREILRMPSQYTVDHPTFPVNQRFFHLIVIQGIAKPQQLAARYLEFAGVYRETFLKIHERLLRHLIPENSILGFLT